MKKVILCILILTTVSEGCKKYPDGPWISFRSAKNRLYGYDSLTKYTVDDIDSLNLFHDSLPLNFSFWYDDVNYQNKCSLEGWRSDGKGCALYWIWELTNHNKTYSIIQVWGSANRIGPFGKNKSIKWTIFKLTDKEVRMSTNYNGKEYKIQLNKVMS